MMTAVGNQTPALDSEHLGSLLAGQGFSAEWIRELVALGQRFRANPGHWAVWWDRIDRVLSENEELPKEQRNLEVEVLVLAVRLDSLFELHSRRGIESAIVSATVEDLPRWADSVRRSAVPGQVLPLRWFRNHLHENLLSIGCLQFMPGVFQGPFRVFLREEPPCESVAIALPGIPCDPDGWPVRENPAFFTDGALDVDAAITGHRLEPSSGTISPSMVRLGKDLWRMALQPGDQVLIIHIPEGVRLGAEACREAFSRAAKVFGSCFPEITWRCYFCTTWMLDPALDSLLPDSSRIRQFVAHFHRATTRHPDGNQMVKRVLDNTEDIKNFIPRTSLQKNVRDHLLAGGIFRTTSGFLLPHEIDTALNL